MSLFDHQDEAVREDTPFTRDFVLIYGRPGAAGYVFDFYELLTMNHRQITVPWEDHEELELGDRIRYFVQCVGVSMIKHTPEKDFSITYECCEPCEISIHSHTKAMLIAATPGSMLDASFDEQGDDIVMEIHQIDLSELDGYQIVELDETYDDEFDDAYDITEELDVEAERP